MAFDAGSVDATLTLDRRPFNEGLRAARRDVERFEKQKREVTADFTLDGIPAARAEAERLKKQIDGLEASPNVGLDTAKARAELAVLNAKLAELDGKDVTVDVNVRRDIESRIRGIVTEVGRLGSAARTTDRDLDLMGRRGTAVGSAFSGLSALGSRVRSMLGGLGGEADSAGGSFGGLGSKVGTLTGELGPMAIAAAVALPLILSLATAAAALVASLAAATAAVGALAVAFGSLFVPAIVLAIGLVQKFKHEAGKTGSEANKLARVFHGFSQAVAHAFGPGIDAAFRGLRLGLQALAPMIRHLRPAFTVFGRAAGQAFRLLGREFASPAWRRFFGFLFRAAARVTPVLTRTFIAFARILRNIARAAMPFLIRGLRDFARWLGQVARGSKGIDLSGVMSQLGAWLKLSFQLGRIFLGLLKALAPQGKGLVGWLTQGAKALADWLNSAKGNERLQLFLKRMLPLAKEAVILFGNLALILAQVAEAAAIVLTPVLRVLNAVLGWINRQPPGIQALGGAFRAVGRAATAVADAISRSWHDLMASARADWHAIRAAAVASVHGIVAAWHGTLAGLRAIWGGIRAVARTIWGAIKAAVMAPVRSTVHNVTADWRALRGAARVVWGAIRGVVVGAAHAASRGASAAFRALLSAIRAIGGRIAAAARGVWHGIVRSAHVVGNVVGIVQRVLRRVIAFIRGLAGRFFNAGKAVIRGFINGVKSMISDAVGAVKDLGDKVKDEVTSGFGLFSPSRVFHGYGRFLMQGFRNGIHAGRQVVLSTTRAVVHDLVTLFRQGVGNMVDAFARLPHGLSRTASQVGRLLRSLAQVVRRAAGFIMHAVSRLTSALGAHVRLPHLDLQLPDLNPRGFARGGLVTQPSYMVGEQAPRHPEVILATNPAYRNRNLGLWAKAGEMLDVPGFQAGGFAGMKPGIVSLAKYFLSHFGGVMSSGFRPGDPGFHGRGLAADIVPANWAAATAYANRIGPQLLEGIHQGPPGSNVSWDSGHRVSPGFWGAATWAQHVSHIHMAVSGMVRGAAAAVQQIGRLIVHGTGPLQQAGQAAVDAMRTAANRYIARHQPATVGIEGIPGIGRGSVAQVASRVAQALHSPHRAVLALFEALWAESSMGRASRNVLQLLPSTAASTGIGITDVAGQVAGFLQRGYYGKGGAISLANRTNWPSYVIAQAVQGSAFASGSNYRAQQSAALSTLRALHYPGFLAGVRNFRGGLAVVGEKGPELAYLPRGTNVAPNRDLDPINEGLRKLTAPTDEPQIVQQFYMLHPGDSRVYRELAAATTKGIAMQGYRTSSRRRVVA